MSNRLLRNEDEVFTKTAAVATKDCYRPTPGCGEDVTKDDCIVCNTGGNSF